MDQSSKNSCQSKIPVFYPTMEEFKNFPSYIDYMESQGAHKIGLAKIVPPKDWTPRKDGYNGIDLLIPAPIKQVASGNKGLFQQLNIQTKPMTVKEFAKLANSPKYAPPKGNIDELERKFWKNLTFNAPIYGADISGTIYDPGQRVWNVGNLGTILDLISSAYNAKIEGVNTAYLYFGMWKTSFCWHTEDMDLYSINYLHYGEPKFWYAIPPQNGRRFERLVEGFFPNEAKRCSAFLRHKMTHISPHVLKRYSIPFDTMLQKAGEFMITFPYSYHAGFNLGYNCAESTNFASRRWIDYGKNCSQCTCSEDMVRIDMDCFVKTYQPSRYELWKQGLDKGHPEDHGKKSTAVVTTKTSKDPEANFERCSFGTVLNEDNVPSSSKGIRKVSHRHPVIKIEDSDDIKKAILQSRKHKLHAELEEDTSSACEEDCLNMNQIKKKRQLFPKDHLSMCSKDSHKGLLISSSDDESQSSDASTWSGKQLEKEFKEIKQKRTSSFKEQAAIDGFMEKVLLRAPELSHVWRLFISMPFDLNVECEFHDSNGRVEPHCDICSLFSNNGKIYSEVPRSSLPLLSSFYVRTSLVPRPGEDEGGDEEKDLLGCKVCNLVVHAECYGASYQDPNNWICDRCNQADFTESHCCLCKLRGGALKRTSCSRWVHVTCALVSCQMVLLKGETKTLVDISKAQSVHYTNRKCSKCSQFVCSSTDDFLIKCSNEDCQERLHISCAHRSKCQLNQTKLPGGKMQVSMKCLNHKFTVHSLSSGDRVVAKHKNHRYYKGVLRDVFEQTFCSVEFEDGSFSKDTYPEDIQNIHVTLDDHPSTGTPVVIKWSDGEMYNAIFKGISQTTMYQVEFADASLLSLEKKHVWPDNDNLPRKVLSRLSEITDTKGGNLSFFGAPETLPKRTRGVSLKHIRDDNFV